MKLKVHTRVRHKEYGEGKINKITPEKVYVAFNGKIFIFDLPEAFENDYLIPIEDDVVIERKEESEVGKKDADPINKIGGTREVILDAADKIGYKSIVDALNATLGTEHKNWYRGTWPVKYSSMPFRIWFPQLARIKDGKYVAASNDYVNRISDDWNEIVFDDLKETETELKDDPYPGCTLVFAKEYKGFYIFRGAFIGDKEKTRLNHWVSKRIATRVKLIGKPAYKIEILDDFRK